MVGPAARVYYVYPFSSGEVASHESAPDYRHTRLRSYASISSTAAFGTLTGYYWFFFFLFLSLLSQKPNHGPTTPLTRPRSSARARRRPAPQSFFPPRSHPTQAPPLFDRSIDQQPPTYLFLPGFFQRRRPWRSFPVTFPLGKLRPAYNKRT